MQLHDLTALVARLAPRKGGRARRLPVEVFAVPDEQQAALDAITVFGINTWALIAKPAEPAERENHVEQEAEPRGVPDDGHQPEIEIQREVEVENEDGNEKEYAKQEPGAPGAHDDPEAEEWHDSLSALHPSLDPPPQPSDPPASQAAQLLPSVLPHATPLHQHRRVSATSSPPTPLIIRDRAPRPKLAVFRGETPRHDERVPVIERDEQELEELDEDEDEGRGLTDEDELSEYERERRRGPAPARREDREKTHPHLENEAEEEKPSAPSTHNTQDSSFPRSQDSGGYGLARYSTAPPLASSLQQATSSASAPASAPPRTVLVPTTDESDPRPAASTASSPATRPPTAAGPAPAPAPASAPVSAPTAAPAPTKRARDPTPEDADADDEDEQPRAPRCKRPRPASPASIPTQAAGPSITPGPKLGGWKPDLSVAGLSAQVVQRMADEAAAQRAKKSE